MSERILQDKLEENLTMAILSVCPEESDPVTFEKLGRILCLMGVFQILHYDGDCQGILEITK
jgi:hypothetical protein